MIPTIGETAQNESSSHSPRSLLGLYRLDLSILSLRTQLAPRFGIRVLRPDSFHAVASDDEFHCPDNGQSSRSQVARPVILSPLSPQTQPVRYSCPLPLHFHLGRIPLHHNLLIQVDQVARTASTASTPMSSEILAAGEESPKF